jgi:hypothetical protein
MIAIINETSAFTTSSKAENIHYIHNKQPAGTKMIAGHIMTISAKI